jgi:hypothetical protein
VVAQLELNVAEAIQCRCLAAFIASLLVQAKRRFAGSLSRVVIAEVSHKPAGPVEGLGLAEKMAAVAE